MRAGWILRDWAINQACLRTVKMFKRSNFVGGNSGRNVELLKNDRCKKKSDETQNNKASWHAQKQKMMRKEHENDRQRRRSINFPPSHFLKCLKKRELEWASGKRKRSVLQQPGVEKSVPCALLPSPSICCDEREITSLTTGRGGQEAKGRWERKKPLSLLLACIINQT